MNGREIHRREVELKDLEAILERARTILTHLRQFRFVCNENHISCGIGL